ncbi:MAG: hypothetical protein ACRDL5_15730 [Solirubrobacteraceae bacterium]
MSRGQKVSAGQTVQMGEILGIGAPGSGEMIRMHSVWNAPKHVQADATTILIGRLSADLPSDQVVSTVDVIRGRYSWIKPTTAGAKWTYERLPAAGKPPAALLPDLLKSARGVHVKRVSSGAHGSKWRLSYTASDLQALAAVRSAFSKVPTLSRRERSRLSGERLRVGDLQITLDARGRVTDLRLGGVMTETRADASARHQPYPKRGVKSVVLLHVAYAYGGRLAITPPPARDVSNPRKPL